MMPSVSRWRRPSGRRMRPSAHSRFSPALALIPLLAFAQPMGIQRKGELWEKDFYGNARTARRLLINAHGPVTLQAGTAPGITYSVHVSIRARTEGEALRAIRNYTVRANDLGDTTIITAPGGPVVSTVVVKTPRLEWATIKTSDGSVEVTGVDGPVNVETGAGEIHIDRVRGDCKLFTGGGDVQVGTVGGFLRCNSGAGRITVGAVRGEASLKTGGGAITANEIHGPATVETGAG